MSGLNQTIYITEQFMQLDLLDQAMTLVHEIQHLIQRYSECVYSLPKLIENDKLRCFVDRFNNGIPLDVGNFY